MMRKEADKEGKIKIGSAREQFDRHNLGNR